MILNISECDAYVLRAVLNNAAPNGVSADDYADMKANLLRKIDYAESFLEPVKPPYTFPLIATECNEAHACIRDSVGKHVITVRSYVPFAKPWPGEIADSIVEALNVAWHVEGIS